ncbi:hypothetical protein P3S67_024086 [Capsicum chacoense]
MKEKEIRPVILCSKKLGQLIKIKSGGHDYEGISYRSEYPFVMLDLSNLNKIKIDLSEETAWVQAGATLGQFYYAIAKRSKVHGFPADNVVDARVMDVNGNIIDREMNEDLLGGGASFGVILRWKLKLVRVPEKLTVFTIRRNLEGNRNLLQKWENISHQLPEDLFFRAAVQNGRSSAGNITKKRVQFYFQAQYLGPVDELIPLLKQYFPDESISCQKVAWLRKLYKEMEPYVAKSPRTAYLNYRDFGLGTNQEDYSYSKAKIWGEKYFKGNFERLAKVKSNADPKNFFRSEQSVPPYQLSH